VKRPTKPAWWPEGQPWQPLVCDTCGADIAEAGVFVDGHRYCPAHADGSGQQKLDL
jgi:hypothetical protein